MLGFQRIKYNQSIPWQNKSDDQILTVGFLLKYNHDSVAWQNESTDWILDNWFSTVPIII